MLTNKCGNILIGKNLKGDAVRCTSLGKKTISEVNGTTREKTIKEIPLTDEKEIFKQAFPQYNDFKVILRHENYKGKHIGTKDYAHLSGVKENGDTVVLMRQNKENSGFSDITLGYDSDKSVPVNPKGYETFESKLKIYRPSDFQIRPTLYTKVDDEFAKSYLSSQNKLKSIENATDTFYQLMRQNTYGNI